MIGGMGINEWKKLQSVDNRPRELIRRGRIYFEVVWWEKLTAVIL
jgi:hypothetical protein